MKQLIAVFLSMLAALAQAQGGPLKIGEIKSYSSLPQFTTPYQRDGKGSMVQWRYADGQDYLPADAYVKARRPAAAMN